MSARSTMTPAAPGLAGAIAALAAIALGSACVDENLTQLEARVSLCPSAEAPAEACDVTIDLGDVPAGRDHDASVYVTNRGTGRLLVDGAAVELEAVSIASTPESVAAGNSLPMTLRFQLDETALGAGSTTLRVQSSDADRREAVVEIAWNAIPPPTPKILLCDGDDEEASCAPDLEVALGIVRPTQRTSRAIFIRNGGDAPLEVETITLEGDAAMSLDSSSRGGTLEPGETAPVIVVYAPPGPGLHEATLKVASDDPATPLATARLRGSSSDNLPPTADAVDSVTGADTAAVRVGDLVGVLGGGSSDPEGDPLVYVWTLVAPAGSAAQIFAPGAENGTFVPDVRGVYVVSLVVRDSLGQESAPAVVTVDAAPRFGFRARLSWAGGGDLDLHLVEAGSAPFSARDCYFDNRIVAAGSAASAADDAVLLDDATSAPGTESAVIEAPAPGTWEVWVHVFDDGGLGAADATVDIVRDDDATPVLRVSRRLAATCDLWHAATVSLPAVTASDPGSATSQQCR
jgi:hypothetical protein